jgi:hypothetical protein
VHIVVDLDGVLRGHRNDEPIMQGIQMVGALSSWNRISFITELSNKGAQQWVNINKIVDYDNLVDSSAGLEGEVLKHRQIKFLRAKGGVDLLITSDPSLWAFAFEQGITSVLFGSPSYTRPEFRPDAPKKVRAWADIEASIAKENELRTKDARLAAAERTRFE